MKPYARKAHSNISLVQTAIQENVMELDESGTLFPKIGEFIRQRVAFQLEARERVSGTQEKMLKIDETDQQILKILEQDSRISYRQLGEKLGIEESTARKRVVRLVEKGVIERFTIDISESTLGRTITAFITVYPSLKHADEIISKLIDLEEVIESYNLSGRCGVFLKATFGDMKALNSFIAKIRGITGIVGIHTCISLETIKRPQVRA